MPGFANIQEYVEAFNSGRSWTTHIRKVPSQTTVAGWWYDFSMAAGFPRPQYYASTPATASVLTGAYGIYHGADKSPASKHISTARLMTPTAAMVGQYILQDYLMYYSFIDCDDLEVQPMDNFPVAGASELPRYANGVGNQVMAVVVAPTTGSGVFTFNYKNQNGDIKTSPPQSCTTTAANIGSLLGSQQAVGANSFGPYLALASGDTGVRTIESVTFTVPNGGLAAFVIVRPLLSTCIREINTERETTAVTMFAGAPRVYDGAYLNYIANVAGTVAAGTLVGSVETIWST